MNKNPKFPSIVNLNLSMPLNFCCRLDVFDIPIIECKAQLEILEMPDGKTNVEPISICRAATMKDLLQDLKIAMGVRWMNVHVPLERFPGSW